MHPFIKLLTTAILILVLLSAGCTDTGGGSVDSPTPHKTAEPTEYPTPTDTPIESQHLYDINPDKYDPIKIEANKNLFGIEIEGSTVERDFSGWESVYDDNENIIFQRETYTPRNFDLYSELKLEQAEYVDGKYDLDKIVYEQNLETGKVALQIDNNAPVIMDADEGWDNVNHYIKKAIHLGLI